MSLTVAPLWALLMLLGVPAPELIAGLLAGLAVALWSDHPPRAVPRVPYRLAQAVVGVAVALQVDLAAIRSLGSELVPVVGLVAASIVSAILCGQLLRLRGVGAVTAFFAAVTGGAPSMLVVADEAGADPRVVAVNQYLRVFMIVLSLPVVVSVVFGVDGATEGGALHWWGTPLDYLVVPLAIALGLAVGHGLRLPAPAMVGPLLVGVAMTAVPGTASVPGWVQAASFLVLGYHVGLQFSRATIAPVARLIPTSIAVSSLTIASCAGLGLLLAALTGVSQLDAYLATTPGGLTAIMAISTQAADDMGFVIGAQAIRLLVILIVMPWIIRVCVGRA